jgi:hypothetical protein
MLQLLTEVDTGNQADENGADATATIRRLVRSGRVAGAI